LAWGLDELAAYPTTGPKRLVLLTDGDTQCGVTICDYVKQHAASSVQITMYTVGLQVSDSAASDLKCAAEQTGGKFLPAASPEDLAEALKEAAAAGLSIDAFVTDYEPWIGPTGTQPFVLLKFYVSGPGGLPAEGAKVRLSNSPKATFTVPASGWLRLVQDVSKGDEVVSITATKGNLTGSKEIEYFPKK
jgi:hypothetical protein